MRLRASRPCSAQKVVRDQSEKKAQTPSSAATAWVQFSSTAYQAAGSWPFIYWPMTP